MIDTPMLIFLAVLIVVVAIMILCSLALDLWKISVINRITHEPDRKQAIQAVRDLNRKQWVYAMIRVKDKCLCSGSMAKAWEWRGAAKIARKYR